MSADEIGQTTILPEYLGISGAIPTDPVEGLERGSVVHVAGSSFGVGGAESVFSAGLATAKNISYEPATGALGGTRAEGIDRENLTKLIARYSAFARAIVAKLCPEFEPHVQVGRASFRPAEIEGRVTSWRHDDTRLHVDSFPATPVQGRRILRVFTNVNPAGRPRVWRVGEAFEDVARRFGPGLRLPWPGVSLALELLHLTKSRRSLYDALMLGLHDAMKADLAYQRDARQTTIQFASGSTWIAFTDQVSHAAMAGQHQLEQTFLLPVTALREPERSPLRVLEGLKGRVLT